MVTQEELNKISEYTRRVRAGEILTAEETADRERLRRKYIDAFKASLGAQLDAIRIQRPDGTLEELPHQDK